jgi:NAD(P)-dependent dehydrogenase (short-subunit alcohol dehydrogenase family)
LRDLKLSSIDFKHCIVIGGSRGLGAALTGRLLDKQGLSVTSISRTPSEDVKDYASFSETGRFTYLQADITSDDSIATLEGIVQGFGSEPICVIFNAARMGADIRRDMTIDFDLFNEVNRVGVTGFGNALKAFESHLLRHGGVVVAVSSFSALVPPIAEPKLAYPASKAFLDMAMRTLRFAWTKRDVKFVTVHLGHLGEGPDSIFSKSYKTTAAKIVDSITGQKIPDEINYPFIYSFVYRFTNKFVPDRVFYSLFNLFSGSGRQGLP